jgi:hypothetical protein
MKEQFITLCNALQRPEIPLYVYFDGFSANTWIKVEMALEDIPNGEEIDILLSSAGGSADDAYKIIRAFRNKYKTINVIVPFWAKSAATLFAFGATRIVLHARGELGPIDAQIKQDDEKTPEGEFSSALTVQSSLAQIEKRSREGMLEMYTNLRAKGNSDEITKIGRKQLADMLLDYSAKFYAPLIEKIDPIEMGKMARTLDIGRMYARRILRTYNSSTSDEMVNVLLDFLVYECPDHGYVVDHSVLSSFLPFAIRADEPPFDSDYYSRLGKLSLHFMTAPEWPTINGFITSFTTPNNSANINKHDQSNSQQQNATKKSKPNPEQEPETGGLGSGPVSNNDKKDNTDGDTTTE